MARHKLTAEQTKVCTRCRHAKAAHVPTKPGRQGACKMKHCTCPEFTHA